MRLSSSLALVALLAAALSPAVLADKNTATIALAEARAGIRAAERDGASELAPTELRSARDHFSEALVDADNRRWTDAEYAATRALRDAELAEAIARAARAEKSREELESVVKTLRQELAIDEGDES